jgi:hypothetical protein
MYYSSRNGRSGFAAPGHAPAVLACGLPGEENREVAHILPGTEDAELRQAELAQYLAVLRGAQRRQREAAETQFLVIKGARDCGATWGQIAEALGFSLEGE